MDIKSFEISMSKDEAEKKAKEKGSSVWKVIFRNSKLTEIRQHFIEFKLITYEVFYRPSPLGKLLRKNQETKKQKVTILADGSTGGVAWVASMPETTIVKDVDDTIVQQSDRDDKHLIERGRKLALRVVHRHVGGIPEIEVLEVESVYRPYWVAFYGTVVQGEKVRYLPIAADGGQSSRSF